MKLFREEAILDRGNLYGMVGRPRSVRTFLWILLIGAILAFSAYLVFSTTRPSIKEFYGYAIDSGGECLLESVSSAKSYDRANVAYLCGYRGDARVGAVFINADDVSYFVRGRYFRYEALAGTKGVQYGYCRVLEVTPALNLGAMVTIVEFDAIPTLSSVSAPMIFKIKMQN